MLTPAGGGVRRVALVLMPLALMFALVVSAPPAAVGAVPFVRGPDLPDGGGGGGGGPAVTPSPDAASPQPSLIVAPAATTEEAAGGVMRAGGTVHLTATGFPPHLAVEIGWGPPNSGYLVLAEGRTDAEGRLNYSLPLPTQSLATQSLEAQSLADQSLADQSLADGEAPGAWSMVLVVSSLDFRLKAVSAPLTVLPADTPSQALSAAR